VPLTRSMPPKRALELMMTGRRVAAAEAERIGFVHRVVPVDALDDAVDELATVLAGKSPSIMKLGRDSFYGSWDLAAEDALRLLHPLLTVTASTEEAAEGIAAFQEQRKPSWTCLRSSDEHPANFVAGLPPAVAERQSSGWDWRRRGRLDTGRPTNTRRTSSLTSRRPRLSDKVRVGGRRRDGSRGPAGERCAVGSWRHDRPAPG